MHFRDLSKDLCFDSIINFTWSEIMNKTCAPKDEKKGNEILRIDESIWLIR